MDVSQSSVDVCASVPTRPGLSARLPHGDTTTHRMLLRSLPNSTRRSAKGRAGEDSAQIYFADTMPTMLIAIVLGAVLIVLALYLGWFASAAAGKDVAEPQPLPAKEPALSPAAIEQRHTPENIHRAVIEQLERAAANGRVREMRQLLVPGINIDAIASNNYNALHSAARHGHEACVQVLLEARADPTSKLVPGWTPLLQALVGSTGGRSAKGMVRLLVSARARVDAEFNQDGLCGSPLSIALESLDVDICSMLLAEPGAKTMRRSDSGRGAIHALVGTLLTTTCAQGAAGTLRGLTGRADLEGSTVEVLDAPGRNGKVHVRVESSGESILARPHHLRLHDKQAASLLEFALANGVSPDMKDHRGYTPLHLALEREHEPSVRLLIEGRADLSTADPMGQGYSALAWVVSCRDRARSNIPYLNDLDHLTVIDILVAGGASLELGMDNGVVRGSVLTAAAYCCNLDAARRLVAAGADVDAKDQTVPGAPRAPEHPGSTPLLTLMHEHDDTGKTGHEVAEFCAFLLESGADPNLANDEGLTPLILAAVSAQLESVDCLLKCPCVEASATLDGCTALDYAKARRGASGLSTYVLRRLGKVVERLQWQHRRRVKLSMIRWGTTRALRVERKAHRCITSMARI